MPDGTSFLICTSVTRDAVEDDTRREYPITDVDRGSIIINES